MEEALALDKSYACLHISRQRGCSRCRYGQILWQQYTVPNIMPYWKLQRRTDWQPPAIDSSLNLLYIGTGNNYTVPAAWRRVG